jgi:hypothetical protein
LKEVTNTSVSTPGKNRPQAFQKSTAENLDEKIIHVSIYNFAVIEGENPTVKKLLAK